MKAFARKGIAMFLALAMMMSVCVFATDATTTPTVVDVKLEKSENAEMNVAYGVSDPGVKDFKVVLTYDGDQEPKTVKPTWKVDKKFNSNELGAIYTYTAEVDGVPADMTMPTVKVTIVPAVITKITYSPADPMQVPVGATERAVKRALPETAVVELQDGRKIEWSIGSSKSDELESWSGVFDEDEVGNNEYTTALSSSVKENFIASSAANLTYTVKALDKITADLALTVKYTGEDDDEYDLADMAASMLEEQFEAFAIEIDDLEVEEISGTYGDVDKYGNYTLDLSKTNINTVLNGGKLTEKKIEYVAADENDVQYKGDLTVTIISSIKNFEYTMEDDEFAFNFGAWLEPKLKEAMVEDLLHVNFSVEEDEGGTLYIDEEKTELDEDEDYYADSDEDEGNYALADMIFIPDGTEADFEVSYIAYGENDEELEGTITIECQEFFLLTADIDSTESVDFSVSDIEDLIEESDYDDYDLDYITGLKVVGGGKLYYDYDEDDKTHPQAKSSTKYYADEDEDDLIDNITYVPAKTTNGQVVISFNMRLVKGSKNETLSATYLINVTERADITVQVAKNGETSFDISWFEDFLEENGGSKKTYDITYIVFEGAPTSKGYLCDDGDKIKKPDGKKFYTEDSDDGDYAFDDLTFKGGTSAATTRGDFTIYGKKSSSSSSTKLVSGTIDFIVGVTNSLDNANSPLKAAQIMSFSNELDNFEALGDNDNVRIQFTSLPKGAKLYYNYGLSTQEDVTVGTDYYLTATSGKKLLKNVTFVPSYSSSKIADVITFGVKGFSSKDKVIIGDVNISVTYAITSAYFSDVKTSTYADSVDFLYNQRITTGMTATTFGLNDNVTRGQFVTFLYRAAGSPAVTGVTNKFTDVKAADYYYNAVLWAVKNGITTGTSTTTFSPSANVTHQELLTFLYRYDVQYLKHSSALGSTSYVYDFSSVDTWAQSPVKWAANKNIIEAGYLMPKNAGTRATVALWLHRMLTL